MSFGFCQREGKGIDRTAEDAVFHLIYKMIIFIDNSEISFP
jgi:hypothetical protein